VVKSALLAKEIARMMQGNGQGAEERMEGSLEEMERWCPAAG
jgi:hypothetical protein